jgi:hypothetical protein
MDKGENLDKKIIRRNLDYEGKIIFPEHHESHAASAFFPSPFYEAAFLIRSQTLNCLLNRYRKGLRISLQIKK